MKNKNARLSCFRESGNDREIFICGEESEKKPIGIFLFALKSEFQKSEENGEKRRKPEKISGFSAGILKMAKLLIYQGFTALFRLFFKVFFVLVLPLVKNKELTKKMPLFLAVFFAYTMPKNAP